MEEINYDVLKKVILDNVRNELSKKDRIELFHELLIDLKIEERYGVYLGLREEFKAGIKSS